MSVIKLIWCAQDPRVVKPFISFRKHNFWSQCGSSKYVGNFAKMPFQIGQIVDKFFRYQEKWKFASSVM